MMQEKRWGAFLCDCRSTVKVDSKKIGNVLKYLESATIIKNIYIKNKLINFITKK